MPNRFYVVQSYLLLFLSWFQKSILYTLVTECKYFLHSVKSFAKIDASWFKCIISENYQKIASTPATPHKQFICLQWKEIVWSIPFYALYFSSMAICLPLSILKYYHIFSHFPIHGIFYYEYWIPKWWLPKDKKTKGFTDSVTVCKCTFISFNLCMLSNIKLLHHHLTFRYFLQC